MVIVKHRLPRRGIMGFLKDFMDRMEDELPLLSSTDDLVKLGIFSSKEQATSRRKKDKPPEFIRFSSRRVVYPKSAVMAWLKYKCDQSEKPYKEVRGKILNQEHKTGPSSLAMELRELQEISKYKNLDISPPVEKKVKDPFELQNVLPILKEFPKTMHPRKIKTATVKTRDSEFLSISRFSKRYPSFTEGFLRAHMKNPVFVEKAVRRVSKRIFIKVEGFWEFLDDCSSERT